MKMQKMKFLFWLLFLVPFSLADEFSHKYEDGEDVVVWMNTVGPYANRQETYEYYQLPYCFGAKTLDYHHETLGEALQGMNLVNSGLEIHFKRIFAPTVQSLADFLETFQSSGICTEPKTLTPKQIQLFRYAILNNYWFTAYIDDLPVGGPVGQRDPMTKEAFLLTHQEYLFTYNKDQIISANITMGNPVALNIDGNDFPVTFTYSAKWVETTGAFEDRFENYLDSDFFEHKIHWISVFNSLMMIIFLTAFVAIILLRTLRRDLDRYGKEEELGDLDRDLGDEYGWKLIHGDVFRPPPHLSMLCALIGTGTQLLVMGFVVILYTIVNDSYVERSSILTASIFIYALTSTLAGFVSGSLYSQYGGKKWIRAMFVTAGLWPGVVSALSVIINFVAIYYSSTKAIPFGTMIAVFAIWIFLIFPLTLLGTLIGKNYAGKGQFPTRVNPIPRPIPEKHWNTEPLAIILMGGILPFGSIFIEIYFVFSSFWAYKIYYVYGFMFLVLSILTIVTACSTIVACYFLLNSEDHRWHWTAFLTGGSISLYVYLYGIHYFFARTKMFGFFQTSFYFGYMFVICFGLMMLCGSVGFFASNIFVKKIYSTVKID